MTGSPRVPPLPPEQWDDDVRAALAAGFPAEVVQRFFAGDPDRMRAPNGLTTLMHHPRLAGPWLAYNAVLLQQPTLEPRLRELMVLRVAWRTEALYEWVQHVRIAKRSGINDDEIRAIAEGAEAANWTPFEAAALAATDQLLDGYLIAHETWSTLATELDQRQLVELVFTVGTYTLLAMAFNSFGMQLDPELDPSLAPILPPRRRLD